MLIVNRHDHLTQHAELAAIVSCTSLEGHIVPLENLNSVTTPKDNHFVVLLEFQHLIFTVYIYFEN